MRGDGQGQPSRRVAHARAAFAPGTHPAAERVRRPLFERGCVPFCQTIVNSAGATLVVRRAATKVVAIILTNGGGGPRRRGPSPPRASADAILPRWVSRPRADMNMRDMYKANGLQIFADWLKQTDAEIRAYAALCVSNLSRTGAAQPKEQSPGGEQRLTWIEGRGVRRGRPADEHCRTVATSGLIPEFIAMLQSENVMELNSAVGVFRNLALPGA